MQERLKALWEDIRTRWQGLDRSNKVRMVSIVLVVIAALGVTMYLALKPKWVELYSDLEYKTLLDVQEKLKDEGMESKITGTNNLSVHEKDVNRGRVFVEASDLVTSDRFTYPDALEYSTISTSEKIVKENLRQATETKIAEMLEIFRGVDRATVSLVIPNTTSYFLDLGEDKEASAAAILTVGSSFDKNTGEALARAISRSVEGLALENIEIQNQYAEVIYSGLNQQENNQARTQMEAKNQYEEKLSQQVRAFLTPFASQIQTISNIEFEWDMKTETSRKYETPDGGDPGVGAISEEEKDSSKVVSNERDAEPGLMSNINQGITYQTGGEGSTEAKNDSVKRSYLYDITETTLEGSVGKMNPEKSSLSIIMYDEEMIYQELITEGDLDGLSWEQFKNERNGSKTPMIVDDDLVTSIQLGTGIERVSLHGYTVSICVDEAIIPSSTGQIAMLATLGVLLGLIGFSLIRATMSQPVEAVEYIPDLSVEDLLVGTQQLEEQRKIPRIQDFEFGQESEMKLLIDDFVDDNPEAVAQILRNWIRDDWE